MQRLRRDVDAEAATPALARGPLRRATAQTMIALGLGPEAQALAADGSDRRPARGGHAGQRRADSHRRCIGAPAG